jgi:ubiquinone/menaquinone biosynthesis C-methylase UbiE
MEPFPRRLLIAWLRLFFKHLYTTFAWTYDFVANVTSVGQWQNWQRAALIDLPEGELLEIGHGPGHMLLTLSQRDRRPIGLDASPQMARIASRRLRNHGQPLNLIQAIAQRLPFPGEYFMCVVSTFPSEYIFDPKTLAEVTRVLQPGGVLIVVGVVKIIGRSIPDRFAAWLYRVTGQAGELSENWAEPLERHGLSARLARIQQPRAEVLRVVATKPNNRMAFAPSSPPA